MICLFQTWLLGNVIHAYVPIQGNSGEQGKQVTTMRSVQLILDEITKRYDQGYADRIQSLAERSNSSSEGEDWFLQLVALYQVMNEEGFSPSERGAILATVLEHLTGQSLSPSVWTEIQDMPVYGTSSFSPEVKAELRSLSHADHVEKWV